MLRRAAFPALPSRLPPLAVSFGAAGLFAVGVIGLIAAFGDPDAARPRAIVSLREAAAEAPTPAPLSQVLVDPSLDAELGAEFADGAPPDAFGLEDAAAPPAPGADPLTIAALDRAAAAAERRDPPLPKAPIPGFTQPGPMGPLPVVAADGRTPFQAYRRPFRADPGKPKVAIVLGGLGFNARFTQQAIDELPAAITLSFVPYAKDLQLWIDRARADGHEVMIEIPMEPFDPEADDTGPQTLLAAAEPRENVARLENLLSRAVGYFGVTNYQGGKFAASGPASAPIARALKTRGLGLIGSGIPPRAGLGLEATRAGALFATADSVIDLRREADAIDEQLLNLEALALERGAAMGAGFAYPVTIDQLRVWSADVERRGYALAPASAIVETRSAAR